MPPAQALRTLSRALLNSPAVNVLVVAEPEGKLVTQRLNLRQDLADEFLVTVRAAVPLPDGEAILKRYDPGYKPDADEIVYTELGRQGGIEDLVRRCSHVQQAELFHAADQIVDSLRFYAVVVSPTARRHAVFFRTYSPKKELTRRPGFAALFDRGYYDKVETKIFLFDRQIDCFSWEGYLFIHNVTAFQRIFRYFEELRARADETVTAILARIPLSNADEFRAACTGQIQMLSKLTEIAGKPYLNRITMADIRRTINEFHLEVQIVTEDGQERLLFEASPARRWLILKMLDDDYLGSILTNVKYEVNSKSVLYDRA